MHVHAQTRRGLRNLACGLAGLQNHSPGPQSRIVHDLGVTVHARAIRNCVSGRSGLLEDEGDVVEWRRTDIGRLVVARSILGNVGKCRAARSAFAACARRTHLLRTIILVRLRGGHEVDRYGVGIMDVIAGVAPGRDIDVQKNDPVVLKDWNVERRLIHGHRLIFELSKRGLSEREGKNGG